MNRTALLLFAFLTVVPGACRPSTDRTEAERTGTVSTGDPSAPARERDPVKRGAENATEETLPENVIQSGKPPPQEAGRPAAEPTEAVANLAIPGTYHGRWGMVPADCTSTRGDAKGLLVIDGRTLRFYESLGTLIERRPAIATSFSGLFSFTGEGQSWQKVVTLTRDGETLTRAEEEGTFTYTRC